MINSYYGLKGKPPESATAAVASSDEAIHCCSGAVILGPATQDGKAIHVSSEDQHFLPAGIPRHLHCQPIGPASKSLHGNRLSG